MATGDSEERAAAKRASAHRMLAAVLDDMGRNDDALSRLKQAVALDPHDAQACCDLATMLHQQGRPDDAIGYFQQALTRDPQCAAAHLGLGIVMAAVGKPEEARRSLETAIELEPTKIHSYFHLARAIRFVRDDRHFITMQRLAQNMSSLSVEGQVYLHFALGKAYGDIGDYERSFQYLLQGNTLKRKQAPYMEAKMLGWLKRVKTVFTPELLQSKAGLGDPSSVPLFIVGMHRSGSTLVEQILASHPKCFGAGELPDVDTLAKGLRDPNAAEFPEAVLSLSGGQLRACGMRYLDTVRRLSPKAERITDKMPPNFVYAGFIHLMFPNARIIHTRRDPRDTAVSCFATILGQGWDYSSDLAELGRFYRQYRLLMAHWRSVLPAGVMLEVDYELLVEDFEGQARRIVAHCGLDWHEDCAAFYRNKRPVLTASVGQVHQPIYRTSVGRWRGYEKYLQPFTQALESNETLVG